MNNTPTVVASGSSGLLEMGEMYWMESREDKWGKKRVVGKHLNTEDQVVQLTRHRVISS